MGRQLRGFLCDFRDNKRAIVWIWIVGLFLSIPFCAFLYFVLDYPFDLVCATCVPLSNITGFMALSWNAVHLIIAYLLAFTLIFSVIWVIQNSKSPGVIY